MNNLLNQFNEQIASQVELTPENVVTLQSIRTAIEKYSDANPFATKDFSGEYEFVEGNKAAFEKVKHSPDVLKAVIKVKAAEEKYNALLADASSEPKKVSTAKGTHTRSITNLKNVIGLKYGITFLDGGDLEFVTGWCLTLMPIPKASVMDVKDKDAVAK